MFKDIHPAVPLILGCLFVGGAISQLNPNTRTLMVQRQQSRQLREAAQIESRNTEAMQIIAVARANCTRVARIDTTATYQFATGTAICDGNNTATIGTDKRPTLLAQEAK